MKEKLYEIWAEGYAVTGDCSGAFKIGEIEAIDFQLACDKYAELHSEFKDYYNPQHRSYWGCKLFDNLDDARKSFG